MMAPKQPQVWNVALSPASPTGRSGWDLMPRDRRGACHQHGTCHLSPAEISQGGTGDVTAVELGHPKPGASLPTVPQTRLRSLRGSRLRWKFNPRDGWSRIERRDERGREGDTGPVADTHEGSSAKHTASVAQLCPVPINGTEFVLQ